MHYRFYNHVDGARSGQSLPTIAVTSIDGAVTIEVPDSDLTELIAARDAVTRLPGADAHFPDSLAGRSMGARMEIVRALFAAFAQQREELIGLVSTIHGTPRAYLAKSFDKLGEWVAKLPAFLEKVEDFSLTHDRIPFSERQVLSPYALITAGNFEAYESFYLLAQTILAGAHFIVRPSTYDIATHIIFDLMAEAGLSSLGQKLTWDATRQPHLIRHLLRFVRGASIFGSDEAIQKMLVTSVLERHPEGAIQERVIEDLGAGKKIRPYGSGNAMVVVLGKPELAAEQFYRAKVIAKGNKCWIPDGAVVLEPLVKPFRERLLELDRANTSERPRFRPAEIKSMFAYLRESVGELDYGQYSEQNHAVGLLLRGNLTPHTFFDREVTFPAAGVVPVQNRTEAVEALQQILARRNAGQYLSLGYFGPEAHLTEIAGQIAAEAYHVNEPLAVNLMEPHQGAYFMLDPTTKEENR
jgi:acyl-CoA reductase-like NAD-dependent aldehyde dehydrogenase